MSGAQSRIPKMNVLVPCNVVIFGDRYCLMCSGVADSSEIVFAGVCFSPHFTREVFAGFSPNIFRSMFINAMSHAAGSDSR